MDKKAHVYEWEVDDFIRLSGLQVRTYGADEYATPALAQAHDHAHKKSLHIAGTGVPCLENTHSAHSGVAVSKTNIGAAADTVCDLGISVHLNDVCLSDARVALDEDPTTMVERVDAVVCCLSKGLDVPVGSMLVGPEAFIEEAVRVRKQFGGGMR